MVDDTTPLPKQELLIKLMGMTTSANDGEALVAVRKANDLLTANKWSWEKLIRGKLKIIEDPFKNIAPVRPHASTAAPHTYAPTKPTPPPPFTPGPITPGPAPYTSPPPRYAARAAAAPQPASPRVKRQPTPSHPVHAMNTQAQNAAKAHLSKLGSTGNTSTTKDIFSST